MSENSTNYNRDLALIGAGYWGKNLARNFNNLGALHTICDASEDTVKKFAVEYEEVRGVMDPAELWKNDEITRVAIAAPAALHYKLAKQALEAGKDVFVEKPLCLDLKDARELLDLALQKRRILMVGHLLQYHPCVEKIQLLLAQGELGKLQYISSNRLNLGKIRKEEDVLWSFAPHDLSVILSLAGQVLPERVRCVGGSYLTPGVADTTMTTLEFSGDIRAHVYVSWLNPFKEQKLTVVGSHGMLVFDDRKPWNEKLTFYRQHLIWEDGQAPKPSQVPGEFLDIPESEPLKLECKHFLDCCDDRRESKTDGLEGLRVLSLLQAAQSSLKNNGSAVSPSELSQGSSFQSDVNYMLPSTSAKEPSLSPAYIHPTAIVDPDAEIGCGTKVWHFSHISFGARIGENCVFGQNTMVANGVRIGKNVKVQNNVSIYSGLTVEDDVFLGPSCVLTNVSNPRSQVNRQSIYEKTLIRKGATVGANATIVPGITLGRYSFVSAGAVVTRDVEDYALMKGVPAKRVGWMSRHGHLLLKDSGEEILVCPESGLKYHEDSGRLKCLDITEDEDLPPAMSKGHSTYRTFK